MGDPVQVAIDWFLQDWLIADKREAFAAALRVVVEREQATGRAFKLYVDYDPNDLLLEAVRAAGVECRGFGSSADGIFAARKCGLWIKGDVVRAKNGYGHDWVTIHGVWPQDGLPDD